MAVQIPPGAGPRLLPEGQPESMEALTQNPSPQRVVRRHNDLRQKWLLNIITIGVAIPALVLLPSGIYPAPDPATLVACGIGFTFALLAWVLNRLSLTPIAGTVLVLGLVGAIGWEMIAKALQQHGLDLSDLRLYDLFALPILLASVLIGARAALLTGVATVGFTVATLLLLPRTPGLQAYWVGNPPPVVGSFYDVIAVPVVIQALTAISAALAAGAVGRSLAKATRAEELNSAYRRVDEQSYRVETQRQRLREGLANLQRSVAAFGRGAYDTRISFPDGELAPLAASLNALFDQMRRLGREQQSRARVEQGAAELVVALRAVRNGGAYIPPNYTGTALDQVLVELATLRISGLPGAGSADVSPGRAQAMPNAAARQASSVNVVPQPPDYAWPEQTGEVALPPPSENPAGQLPSWLRSQ